ncbi:prepilin-type N-terminal cleavage/methylation domain-containing protein [Phyllobacterium sp. 21LDTY02-6]|jgi:prepilin-type N-terminal cleavage/methylation domain-containing protein|uniref:PulJ/GspJ family protein n=1 Tax=unclassified Phyllobacterium TaxID=2638441 RepID=UPI002020550E|nr:MULTISPECIES: prepilin-type N-terminal cleavage/methylation domain-containing protein [unclassified Phyllobacterium]MCO4318906.1 prepilin-type N-terminal cleavage/methylation domain-containing protein [Phyllobacterium sp. 21LDTY02-6]MCX8278880.1 prepilin-type N-terminal cleavage/methylation domain-containing protein [Phyllobacterium sp. 0TCS1.6C]MCX8293664.1 prepilin-type N-terminal cleavage/methylation domain-containing protein [Phyllobacterium sp. 0TCS1.6A]
MIARHRRGFTLIEVLASLAVAVLLIIPIARMITGTAGAFAGLERSTERRVGMQAAMAVAMTLNPLRTGRSVIGDFTVIVERYRFERDAALTTAGWQLYSVTVRRTDGSDGDVTQTVRLGKLQ